MASKVNCTCGWSWNKSDSSKKDMYICHECGRDNSNNIPKAQDGIQKMSSKDKRGIELLIKETKNAKNDKQELMNTGQIKNPKSIAYKSKIKKQPELNQDNRNNYEKEYDRKKGQKIEDKKQLKKNIITPLDVATDIMQLGNFVPNPVGQGFGKIGNILGAGIDAYQAYDEFSEGNYTDAAINAGSVFLPMGLDSKTFRRNSKYLKPGQPLNFLKGTDRVNYIEPFTKVKGMTNTSLLANRALLGTLGAETMYDIPKQKNGGWLDNYNDSEVSAPEGFQGDGYSNVGRNSSPAWGGQFQMGGVLPGAVGNMYARHGAPSKGPRRNQTDVTDASAQNGKEMQYYQQGLDWKPKSISKNGGWLDVHEDDRGQWGKHKGEPTRINQSEPGSYIDMGPDPLTGEPLTEPLLGISDKGEKKMMYPGEKHKFKKGTKYVDEYPKGKLAKNGMRQEQKGLQNLDQLTNFTNYNTKQPGGWLDNL